MAGSDSKALVEAAEGVIADVGRAVHPHFVDTRAVPWLVFPASPDVGLKLLRISEETGTIICEMASITSDGISMRASTCAGEDEGGLAVVSSSISRR